MSRSVVIGLMMLTSVSLYTSQATLAADPTLHQVYQAAETGNFSQAQGMLDKVLHDHPNSAKAHFVRSEILAKQGRRADAQSEFNTAQRLAPGLPFANAQAVRELKARLAPTSLDNLGPSKSTALRSNLFSATSVPWGPLLLGFGLFALVFFVTRVLSRRPAQPLMGSGSGYGPSPAPFGANGGGPMAPSSGGMGSGILGGLATGAAVGAGMVAGEALMHRLTGSNHSESRIEPVLTDIPNDTSYDMGGSDFGIADSSSWDDNSSVGADDWD